MNPTFDLQGHRGARGLKPENTLASFEAALDAGVSSIETDLHLTRDGVVVLCHDPEVNPRLFHTAERPVAISSLTLAELRRFVADRNPDSDRFPNQDSNVTPAAAGYAAELGMAPNAVPTLSDLFAFVAAYAGELGKKAGKSDRQREKASRLRFDLELKRVPFFPEAINDGFDGQAPAMLERNLVEAARSARVTERTTVRSFDHRSVATLLQLEPRLTGAILMAETAPADPSALARLVGASVYCPSYQFLDRDLIRHCHAANLQVLPWTVNDLDHCRRLLDYGVDGITTDFPDRIARELLSRGINY